VPSRSHLGFLLSRTVLPGRLSRRSIPASASIRPPGPRGEQPVPRRRPRTDGCTRRPAGCAGSTRPAPTRLLHAPHLRASPRGSSPARDVSVDDRSPTPSHLPPRDDTGDPSTSGSGVSSLGPSKRTAARITSSAEDAPPGTAPISEEPHVGSPTAATVGPLMDTPRIRPVVVSPAPYRAQPLPRPAADHERHQRLEPVGISTPPVHPACCSRNPRQPHGRKRLHRSDWAQGWWRQCSRRAHGIGVTRALPRKPAGP
jgi:hypothetical protein